MKANWLVLLTTLVSASFAFAGEFELRVNSEADSQPVGFRAAIGYDNKLSLIEAATPYTTTIDANKVTALFESIDASQSLEVKLVGEIDGEAKVISSFSGAAGRIIEEPGLRQVSDF